MEQVPHLDRAILVAIRLMEAALTSMNPDTAVFKPSLAEPRPLALLKLNRPLLTLPDRLAEPVLDLELASELEQALELELELALVLASDLERAVESALELDSEPELALELDTSQALPPLKLATPLPPQLPLLSELEPALASELDQEVDLELEQALALEPALALVAVSELALVSEPEAALAEAAVLEN